ncbi:hypothetical protein QYE76_038487 [Lolium multiflorum]|uniref:Uncharacterized protein n=1 Tax=Lolium multiflorum TaxID=4521 RepID=A0AAD8T9B3_LOLMU|nr:hypothetical protein QYE76_038487 [Lolium multiflorum]
MPPLAAADAFLVLDFLAGNRRVPLPAFSALVAALPSVSGHTSQRLRKSVALRALDAALSDPACADASAPLRRARAVLAEPDLADCFPDHLAVCDDLPALKRLVDAEWTSLPPSVLEAAADRIVGDGALHTWAKADQDTHGKLRVLVGESTEREILGKLGQDPAPNAPSTSGGNEAGSAQQEDESQLGRETGKASHVQEDCTRLQQEPVERAADVRLPEKPVTRAAIRGKDKASPSRVTGEIGPGSDKSPPAMRGSRPGLMERNPTSSVFEIEQDPSGVPLADKAANAPSTSGANEPNRAQQDDEVHLGTENGKADHVQESCARQQEEPVERSMDGRLPEKSVTSKTIKGKDKATPSNVTGEIAPDNNKSHPVTSSKPSLMERNPTASAFEIGQDPSGVPVADKADNAPSTSGANEANRAQQYDGVHLGTENGKADHVQESCARQQEEPVQRSTDGRLPEKSVTSKTIKGKDKATSSNVTGEIAPDNNKSHPVTSSKPSLMERNPTASAFEWDDSSDSDPGRPPHKRQLPTYEMKRRPPPTFPNKRRKRWSEIEEQTLIEGVEKYGKGSWKDIKTAYPRVFADRSQVDLKDKFRNMERYNIN